jgi:hypothetical protein
LAAVAVTATIVTGCGGSADTDPTAAPSARASTTSATSPSSQATRAPTSSTPSPPRSSAPITSPPGSVGLPQGADPFALDPATFTTTIDNPYWPITPGTRWTYREVDEEGNELEVVVVVTTLTRVVANGITARVVRDTVRQDGDIVEDTFDWYAQDASGNIWYLGEETAELDHGQIVSTEGSWEAGVDGALAGVALPADPQPGMRYRQEYYAGHAEDSGEVLSVTDRVDVAYGHFDNVLLTEDTNGLDPNAVERKQYASGVGPIRTIDVGGSGSEELLAVDTAAPTDGTGPLGAPSP